MQSKNNHTQLSQTNKEAIMLSETGHSSRSFQPGHWRQLLGCTSSFVETVQHGNTTCNYVAKRNLVYEKSVILTECLKDT